jgi:hypothetical protein
MDLSERHCHSGGLDNSNSVDTVGSARYSRNPSGDASCEILRTVELGIGIWDLGFGIWDLGIRVLTQKTYGPIPNPNLFINSLSLSVVVLERIFTALRAYSFSLLL